MMSVNKLALLIAAAISTVQAIDATQSAELNAILDDAKNNLEDYMSIATEVSIPPGIFQVGLALATATDDSYTTLYSEIDFNQVSSLMTALPWYSSRLQPEIAAALATMTTSAAESTATSVSSSSESPSTSSEIQSSTVTSAATSEAPSSSVTSAESSEAPSSSVTSAESSEAPSSSVTSAESSEAPSSDVSSAGSSGALSSSVSSAASSEAPSSSVSSAESSGALSSSVSSAASSGAPSTTLTSAESSKAASSTASLVSQTSDGQISEQTTNGAPKAAIGMGAGILAAAALLL